MAALAALLRALNESGVRYVLIGVAGANFYAPAGSAAFYTRDRDLFLPPDAANLLLAWQACEGMGLVLTCSGEPLDSPRDSWLAERTVQSRSLTRAVGPDHLEVDLTLTMAGFEFEEIWRARREYRVDDVPIPVARLVHIVTSKALAGRPKDQHFLATHAQALRELLSEDEKSPEGPK